MHKKGPNGIGKCQKQDSIERKFASILKYGGGVLSGKLATSPVEGNLLYFTIKSCFVAEGWGK